jgi:hypothetical protein
MKFSLGRSLVSWLVGDDRLPAPSPPAPAAPPKATDGEMYWSIRSPLLDCGPVKAATKSEARSLLKVELGIGRKGRLPAGVVVSPGK